MKKVRFFYLVFVFGVISGTLNAQIKDSINITTNRFYEFIEDDYFTNPVLFTQTKLKSYTQTKLEYQYKDLEFRRVQSPKTSSDFHFSTTGLYNFNSRLKIFGSFNFNKINDKKIAYNLSSETTENQNVLSPNYFIAPKAGNWERQKYNLNGGGMYQFKSNIYLATTVFYKSEKSFRTNDPRPNYQISDFGGNLQTGYAFKNHTIYVKGGFSKKTQTASMLYVNDNLATINYPETFTRYSSGYGRLLFNSTYGRFIFRNIRKSFGGGYQYLFKNNTLSANYQYEKSLEDFYRKSADGYVYFDNALISYKYRIKEHKAHLKYYHDGATIDYKLQVGFNHQKGDNYSVTEQGQNYRSSVNTVSFKGGISKQTNQIIAYGIDFNIIYKDHSYIDLLGYTNKSLSSLEVETILNKDVLTTEKNKLNLALSLGYYFVPKENLIYNPVASDTFFGEHVIIPNQAYDITSKITSKLYAGYNIIMPKNKNLTVFTKYSLLATLDKKYQKYISEFNTPNNSVFTIGLIINY